MEILLDNNLPPLKPLFNELTYDEKSWKNNFLNSVTSDTKPFTAAVQGGLASPCAAWAFAAGLQSAIQALLQLNGFQRPWCLRSFCVSEKEGNHPQAIKTQLSYDGDKCRLNGVKSFVSLLDQADELIVIARTGFSDDGKIIFKPLLLSSALSELNKKMHKSLPFLPEISHGEIHFSNIKITHYHLLEGDGYSDYIRPFRLLEDAHVLAALAGMWLKFAMDYGSEEDISHILIVISQLMQALREWGRPVSTILTFNAGKQLKTAAQAMLPRLPEPQQKEWLRDKPLLEVAKAARLKLVANAWQKFSAEMSL